MNLYQLEEVMEKETYKKAKEILEKFDPARFRELEVYIIIINLLMFLGQFLSLLFV